jgi:hypothetical protein
MGVNEAAMLSGVEAGTIPMSNSLGHREHPPSKSRNANVIVTIRLVDIRPFFDFKPDLPYGPS